eukprot:UN30005
MFTTKAAVHPQFLIHTQIRHFGLKANRFKRNVGSNVNTRKSWVQPRRFRKWLFRKWKHYRYQAVLRQREVVYGKWDKSDPPLAVKTTSDFRTEPLVRRFPNLGVYTQKSLPVKKVWKMSDWIINDTHKNPDQYRQQPKHYKIFHMVHAELIKEHPTAMKEIDFNFKPGDVVE